jgi:peptidoglycan/LPS O-acetylase OafA/YrhL
MLKDAALVNAFLWGISAMSFAGAGVLLLRFWRQTRDRFFALFAAALWLLALNYVGLGLLGSTDETRHFVYLVRLIAFVVLIAAIIDKNRRPS